MKQAPLRKIPTQDRSKRRVEGILDAAATLFGEVGYEAATTEAVAERAGVSIGSLYQFFPNKSALFFALAQRYHARERALFDSLVNEETLRIPWPELLDHAIDAFYALHRTDPVLRVMWQSFMLTGELLAAGEALNQEFARRVEQVFAIHAPRMPAPRRALVATVVVQTLTAMLFLSAREPERGDAIVAEAKVLVYRYLAPYAEAFGARKARPKPGHGGAPRKAPARRSTSR